MADTGPSQALFVQNPGSENCNPTGIGLRALIAEDLRTHDGDVLAQGFWALFWHRFGNWRMGVRPRLLRVPLTLLYRMMHKLCQWMGGIDLPYTVRVGRRVRLEHFGGMILVAQTIGDDVIIRQNTTFGIAGLDALKDRPVIGNRVELGAGAVVVGPIHVGDDAIVGANAVVTKDVPAGAIVGGVPARLIRMKDGFSA
ncbi:serine O-acetyltransferase [Tropicimonas sp. S265A]|uniref:serine O-acetyltransferase n=1 Tax=Tropicimonas sp. S265A TaxID=3415134 RepID=UPI003C7B7C1D